MSGKAHGGNFTLSGTVKNQPTGLRYDAAGNLMAYLSASYVYDPENRIASTAGMSYTYDGNGERVLKSQTAGGAPVKRYWSMDGSTLAESDGSGNLTAEYVYFGSKRIARIDLPAGSVHYYLSDHLNSTSMVVSSAGAVEEESDYSPLGSEYPITGPGANRYKFTGKERDAETGLDVMGLRYYGSALGRFMTPDLLGGHRDDPQSFNKYTYVRNNPVRLTDPTGLDFNLQCTQTKDNASTCQGGVVGTTTTATDGSGNSTTKFTPTVVTSESLQDSNSGNAATVNETGVQITTGGQTYQGIFISNTPAADIQGSGALIEFSFHIDGNCNGSCLSSGEWTYNGSLNQARALLYERGSFTIPFEDLRAGVGGGAHPFSTQHRFGGPDCSFLSCPNSPHLSVAYDPGTSAYRAAIEGQPRATVPTTSSGGFHVDAHADWIGHAKDVNSAPKQ